MLAPAQYRVNVCNVGFGRQSGNIPCNSNSSRGRTRRMLPHWRPLSFLTSSRCRFLALSRHPACPLFGRYRGRNRHGAKARKWSLTTVIGAITPTYNIRLVVFSLHSAQDTLVALYEQTPIRPSWRTPFSFGCDLYAKKSANETGDYNISNCLFRFARCCSGPLNIRRRQAVVRNMAARTPCKE